jgi:hypothetical protein
MQTAMPTGVDLSRFIEGAGLTIPNGYLDLDGAVYSAIEEWEERTGFMPFFTPATDPSATRYYSPGSITIAPNDQPVLELGAGLLSVQTFMVGVTPTDPGKALTSVTDYILCPVNAPAKQKPFTYITFISPFAMFGNVGPMYPNSIQVTGRWGYWTSVPEAAWRAILCGAAARLAPQLSLAIRDGVARWTEGDVSNDYGSGGYLQSQVSSWREEFDRQSGFGGRFHRLRAVV